MRKNTQNWKHFLTTAQAVADQKELDGFLELLLTPEEKSQLMTRLLIVEALLKNKMPQREIAKELGISIAKITRGSNALKILKPRQLAVFREIFEKGV